MESLQRFLLTVLLLESFRIKLRLNPLPLQLPNRVSPANFVRSIVTAVSSIVKAHFSIRIDWPFGCILLYVENCWKNL